jgi:hypothetical protein
MTRIHEPPPADFLADCRHLEVLSGLWGSSTGFPFRLIPSLGVLAGPSAKKTLEALVGRPPYMWLRRIKGEIAHQRRQRGSRGLHRIPDDEVVLSLPADAVVLYRPLRGLVALSAAAGRVLKILHGAEQVAQIAQEERVAILAHQSMALPLVPRLFDSGMCGETTRWAFTELAANTRPLLLPRIFPLGSAHRFRTRELSAFLFELCRVSPWEVTPQERWFTSLQELVRGTRNPEVFAGLMTHARDALAQSPDCGAVFSLIHADLKIEHIHRSDKGCFVIDWGMASQGPIIIDWFWELLMLRLPFYYGPMTEAFIAWLKGTRLNPPGIISRNLEDFFALVKRELGVDVPRRAWRFQVLAATVHLHYLRDTLLGVSPRRIARLL